MSDWMYYCDDDFNDDFEEKRRKMSRREALKVRDVSRSHYGGYTYDYNDRKRAQETLGSEYWSGRSESKRSKARSRPGLPG